MAREYAAENAKEFRAKRKGQRTSNHFAVANPVGFRRMQRIREAQQLAAEQLKDEEDAIDAA